MIYGSFGALPAVQWSARSYPSRPIAGASACLWMAPRPLAAAVPAPCSPCGTWRRRVYVAAALTMAYPVCRHLPVRRTHRQAAAVGLALDPRRRRRLQPAMIPLHAPRHLTHDPRDVIRNIAPGEDGIWRTPGIPLSIILKQANTPASGVEDVLFWFAHRNRCIAAVVTDFATRGLCPIVDVGGGNGYVAKMLHEVLARTILVEPAIGVRKARAAS